MNDDANESIDRVSATNSFGSNDVFRNELSIDSSRHQKTSDRDQNGNPSSSQPNGGPPLLNATAIRGYQIVRLIGRGGMGVVYEAIELELNRHVAIKVPPADALIDAQHIARFKNEARAVAQLNHDNIVPIYQIGSSNGMHYYSMQLIEGQNLSQVISLIKQRVPSTSHGKSAETPRRGHSKTLTDGIRSGKQDESDVDSSKARLLSVDDYASAFSARRGAGSSRVIYRSIAEIGSALASALDYAHAQGIVHRDIKPSNILIDETGKPWITDFGLAMIRNNPGATRTGDVVGTYRYMSPEQASGKRFLMDHRTDIYSLGVTLYEMASLTVPYPGTDPQELLRQVSFEEPRSLRSANPNVPEELEIIINKSISKNPQDRYETAAELASDLRRFAQGKPILARRASLAKQTRRWIERHQVLATASAIVIFITMITSLAAAGAIWNSLQAEREQRELTEEALDRTEGLRLIAISNSLQETNPGLAHCLAVEGARLAPGQEANAALLAALANNHETRTLTLRDQMESRIDMDGEGRFMVTTSITGHTKPQSPALVVDVATGQIVRTLADRTTVSSAVFHPSGNYVLTAASKGLQTLDAGKTFFYVAEEAMLWDLRNQDAKIVFRESSAWHVDKDSFSADGRLVILPSNTQHVSIYSVANGERETILKGHSSQVMRAILSRDGKRAVSIDAGGTVIVWNTTNAKSVHELKLRAPSFEKGRISLSLDGNFLIVTSQRGLQCFSIKETGLEQVFRCRETSFVLHPFLPQIFCHHASASRRIQRRDLNTGEVIREFNLTNAPSKMRCTEDGQSLLVAMTDSVALFNSTTGKEIMTLRGHQSDVMDFATDKDCRVIASTSADNSVRVWSRKTWIDSHSFEIETWAKIPTKDSIDAFGDRVAFATDAYAKTVSLDLATNQITQLALGKINRSNHDSKLTAICNNYTATAFELSSNRKLASVTFNESKLHDAICCAGSSIIVLTLDNNNVYLWNASDQSLRMITGERLLGYTGAVSPDGRQVAFATEEGDCRIFDTRTGQRIQTIEHEDLVTSVAWSAKYGLFTMDDSSVVRQWAEDLDKPLREFTHPGADANQLVVHESAGLLVAWHAWEPRKYVCWNIERGDLLSQFDASGRASLVLHPEAPVAAITSATKGTDLWSLESGDVKPISRDKSVGAIFVGDQLLVANLGIESSNFRVPRFYSIDSGNSEIAIFRWATSEKVGSIPLDSSPTQLSIDATTNSVLISQSAWLVAMVKQFSNQIEFSPPFSAPVCMVRAVPQRSQWLIASVDGSMLLMNDEAKLVQSYARISTPISTGSLSPDGKLFAIGAHDGSVHVYELTSATPIYRFESHTGPVKQIEFESNNNCIVSSGEDGRLVRLDLRTQKSTEYKSNAGILSFSLLNRTNRALVIHGSDQITFIPRATGRPGISIIRNQTLGVSELLDLETMASKKISDDFVIAGCVRQSDDRIAILKCDPRTGDQPIGNLRICTYDAEKLEKLHEWKSFPIVPIAIEWNGSSDQLLSLGDDSLIAFWDTNSGLIDDVPEVVKKSYAWHHSVRYRWQPLLAAVPGEYFTTGASVRSIPIELFSQAEKTVPRKLSDAEMARYQPKKRLATGRN